MTMTTTRSFYLLLATILVLVQSSSALYFYLEGSEEKCFIEELPKDTLVVGHYKAEEWNEQLQAYVQHEQLGVQVQVHETALAHRVVNHRGPPEGKFSFTAVESGDHSICISNNASGWFSSAHVKLNLDMAIGDATHDTEADREHYDDLATRVRDLNNRLQDIRREQTYQREREAEFRDQSETVNARAVYWSLVQIGVLAVTCVWQLRHLKGFFEAKKLV